MKSRRPTTGTLAARPLSSLSHAPFWWARIACWYRSGLLLNFAFHGQTGRGKTHLAIAVGSAAVSAGRTVRFFGTAGLVLSLLKASREEALDKYLADIEKSDLVILDEFGYIPIDPEGARLLFQVISSCCERRSLILTTNIEFGKWGTVLGDEKLAAAAIDRIVHHGWLVEFGGESKRMGDSLMLGKR